MKSNKSIKRLGNLTTEMLLALGIMAGVKPIGEHFGIIASGTIGILFYGKTTCPVIITI